jgi:hypothetical protein
MTVNWPALKQSGLVKICLLLGIAGHLAVLGSGMIRKPFMQTRAAFEIKKIYQMITSAGASYGFFSPNIGNEFLVRFEIMPGHIAVSLADCVSHEVALRVGNMNRYFLYKYDNENHKRALAASLTAPIFDRFPKAERVTFIAELYFIPTMVRYQEGDRPNRKEIYRAVFTLPRESRKIDGKVASNQSF